MKVDISFQGKINRDLKLKINLDEFSRLIKKVEICSKVKIKPELKKGFISLVFVDDNEICRLNGKWRNQDKATDVLSFSHLEGDNFPFVKNDYINLGEIFISLETALAQSVDQKNTFQYELNKLFVHGVLHIFGFLHDTEDDFLKMNSIENELLKG